MPHSRGEYQCPVCDTVLEKFDGTALVAYRLVVQPLRERNKVTMSGLPLTAAREHTFRDRRFGPTGDIREMNEAAN